MQPVSSGAELQLWDVLDDATYPFHGCTFAVAGYQGAMHGNLVCEQLV